MNSNVKIDDENYLLTIQMNVLIIITTEFRFADY